MKKTLEYIDMNGFIVSYDIYGQDKEEINEKINIFFKVYPRCTFLNVTY